MHACGHGRVDKFFLLTKARSSNGGNHHILTLESILQLRRGKIGFADGHARREADVAVLAGEDSDDEFRMGKERVQDNSPYASTRL